MNKTPEEEGFLRKDAESSVGFSLLLLGADQRAVLERCLLQCHQKMQMGSSFARNEDWFCQKFADNYLNVPNLQSHTKLF